MSERKSKRVIWIAAGVAVLCVLIAAYPLMKFMVFGGGNFQRPPITITAIEAAAGNWTPNIEAVGTAQAVRGVDIAVEVAGVVKSINFQPNTSATEKQLLVQIDDAVERADMLAAEANIHLFQSQLDRAATLRQKGNASQAALDDARAQLDIAKSTLARLQAVTDQKSIEAPFAGMLGIARVDVGEYVAPGKTVVTLQDLSGMRVDFTVPEQSAGLLKVGQPTRFGLTGEDLPFSGHIRGIDPKVDPQTRLVAVEAELDNPGGRVVPGQFVRIRVELPEEQNVVALPQTAIVPSLYGDYVYLVVKPDAQAGGGDPNATVVRQTFVKANRRNGDRVEITEGVKPGDIVMSVGQNKVQNGARVAVEKPPTKSADAGAAP
jgi:membrane fusion protein, multidrug efflux system